MNLRALILAAIAATFFTACTKKDSSESSPATSTPSSPSVAGTRHFRSMKCHSVAESNYSTTPATILLDSKDTTIIPDVVITISVVSAGKILFDGDTYSQTDSSATKVSYWAAITHSTINYLDYYPVQDSVCVKETRTLSYNQGDTLNHQEEWKTYLNSL